MNSCTAGNFRIFKSGPIGMKMGGAAGEELLVGNSRGGAMTRQTGL